MKQIITKTTYFTFLLCSIFVLFSSKAKAASFEFSPANGTISKGCTSLVSVIIDTEGKNSNAADLEISFDPSKVEIIDMDPYTQGIQVLPGDVYESFVYNEANNTTGKIIIAAGSYTSTFNGREVFLSFKYKSKLSVGSANFNIDFQGNGNTKDSNIAETTTSTDLLNSTVNGSYTLSDTLDCANDNSKPIIEFTSPLNNEQNVSSKEIIFDLIDDESGVDLTTLKVNVNGTDYYYGDPVFEVTGNPSHYIIKLNLPEQINVNKPTVILVEADDFAGNSAIEFITINAGSPVNIDNNSSPEIILVNPEEGTKIGSNDSIQVNITDNGDGIDLNSVLLILNGKTYTINDEEVTYSGDANDYIFKLTPKGGFEEGQTYYLTIFSLDNEGNPSIKTFTFVANGIKACPCINNNNGFASNLDQFFMDLPFLPEFIKNMINTFGILSLAASLLLGLVFLSFFNLIIAFLSGFGLLISSALLSKPNHLVGIIHGVNSEPIRFARIKFFSKDNILIAKCISDIEGRYGVQLPTGEYLMEASYLGHTKYSGATTFKGDYFFHDVNMQPLNSNEIGRILEKVITFLYRIRIFPIILGLLLAIIASLSTLTPLNTLLLVVFIIIFTITIHNIIRTQRNWGMLASRNRPHSNSITRIFNADKKLADTLVSYKNMKFGFPENPKGDYEFEITTKEYDLAKTQKAGKVSKQRIRISNQKLNRENIIKLKQE